MKQGQISVSRHLGVRAMLVVVVIVLVRVGVFRNYGLNTAYWRAGVGLALLVFGLGFAVWGTSPYRRQLGLSDDAEG